MRFIARKYSNLIVTLDPAGTVIEGGQRVMKGLKGEFMTGMRAEFHDGVFETDDERIIDAMQRSKSFGVHFYAESIKGADEDLADDVELAKEQEKKDYADKLASKCEFCGKEFPNTGLLSAHHKKCKKNPNI